jgi:hypothetical protein
MGKHAAMQDPLLSPASAKRFFKKSTSPIISYNDFFFVSCALGDIFPLFYSQRIPVPFLSGYKKVNSYICHINELFLKILFQLYELFNVC